jgi:hypothetical protein
MKGDDTMKDIFEEFDRREEMINKLMGNSSVYCSFLFYYIKKEL